MKATTTTSSSRPYKTAQRIRDLYHAGELRARIPELIEQMGFKRPSRQAVDSALKAHYDRPGRPLSKLTEAGLLQEIYDAYREGAASFSGMKIPPRLRDAILVAELRIGEIEAKRLKKARQKAKAREARTDSGPPDKRPRRSAAGVE